MVVGDLGFRAILVLVLLVFPAIGLFIRRKWRLAAARREEIRLLLAMASEEAARAEFEATVEYAASSAPVTFNAVPSPLAPQRYCAVCYAPTTSRCRRCKSVRYCSTKCQVIHWRQGHKHECSPTLINNESSDEGVKLASKVVKQNHNDDDLISKSTEEESESDSSVTHDQNSPQKKSIRSDHVQDESIPVPKSFSAFASSAASPSSSVHKISKDDPVLEDEKLHNLDASEDVVQGVSHPVLNPHPFADANRLAQANGLSSSASAIEIDHFVSRPSNAKGESQCISTSPSDSDENLVPEPSAASSGFWDGCLDASITEKITRGNVKLHNDGLIDRNGSDSRSFQRSTFDFNGESLSDLKQNGSELSNHTFGGRQATKPRKVTAMSENEPRNSFNSSDSVLLASKQTIPIERGINNVSNCTKYKEECVSSRASFNRSSKVESRSVASDDVKHHDLYDQGSSKHSKESFQLSTSKKDRTPQNVSKVPSLSDANKHPASALKPLQAGNDNRSVVQNQEPNILPISREKVSQFKASKLSRYYSFGVGSSPSVQNNEKGLFPYDLFVKLYNWKEVELRPCGLINCGNSCYANAVLQCLAFTPPLTAYLLQGFHSKTCSRKDWCFTCELEGLILAVKKGGAPFSPIGILSHIEKIGSRLANGREEDAHEFMRYSIDTMQSICLQEARVSGAKSLEEETTLLGLTFGGYLRSKIRCMRCRGKSEQHERMMDLTVEIEGNIETLEEALRKFTGAEILDGENKYQCSRCKSYEKAKKRLTIYEAPNVLTIALKRYQAGKFGKLNKSIRFPEVLDLAPYMRGTSDKSPIYRLYGVVVHLDVMNATFSGHYICYVRNAQNKWFKIDDSMVKAVEMDGVLKEGAYMLFYSRYSPRAPPSIRESMVSRNISSKSNLSEAKSPQDIDGRKGFLRVGGGHPNESGFSQRAPYIQEIESCSSDTSSLFSHSEGASSTTDSNQESSFASTDEFLELHNYYSYWRNDQLDSDTSSSSSPSSSPLYRARPSLLPIPI